MSFAQPFHDYEILDRVGAGAMGTVFKARHKKLGRIVALKVLRPSLARDLRYVDRLRREARIVAALNHPNIVTGYDLGEEGGYHYFVMEFVEGKSLRALLSEWGIFSEDQVLSVATHVAAALDHAFQRNVIHRDVKPGNILIDESGNVKLTDMGLAKGPADLTLTRDGATVGTPQYISPEQAKNPQDVDVRSDLYSLGATLYHMATGQPPFQGTTMAEVITQVLHEVPIAPRVINPALGDGLALVIRKLLSKNLRLRYQTPRELLDDLERVKNEQPPQVDESRLSAGEQQRQPSALLWSLGIVGAAALLAGAVWLGTQLSTGASAPQNSDSWVAALREEVQALPKLGQRLQRLRSAAVDAPPGTAQPIEMLQRQVTSQLQQAVDALVAELRGDAWGAIEAVAHDPQRWPSAAEVHRDRVSRPLQDRTGFLREQLPTGVSPAGLDRIETEIEQLVQQRDRGLQDRAGHHIDVVLPLRAEERLRQGDFAGAERIWLEGLASFFDGLRQPQRERIAAAVRAPLEARFKEVSGAGNEQVAAAEQRTAAALVAEADAGVAALRQRLQAGLAPDAVKAAAVQLREQVSLAYPAPGRFRAAANPWPHVSGSFEALARELDLAIAAATQREIDLVADLAWRAFCDGDAAAGVAVLGNPAQGELAAHRQALAAAARVGEAVLRALHSAAPPIPGYPRQGSGLPVELRVELRADGAPQLLAQVAGGTWRAAQLTEFRFGDLWRRAEAAAPDVLAAVPEAERVPGRTVLAMASDALSLLAENMAASDQVFLRDDVWPRILRVRSGQAGVGVDRAVAFGQLQQALRRARDQRQTRELEAALATWNASFGADASAPEAAMVSAAAGFLEREQARRRRLLELRQSVPEQAVVDVADDGAALLAEVTLPPPALRGAGEGWQLHAGRLEYACTAPLWSDVERRRLDVDGGLAAAALRAAVEIDLVLPPGERGPRLYVLEFRGIGCALVATADDRVFAAMVEGESRAAAVDAAVRRALGLAIDRQKTAPRLLPGAAHRVVFAVDAAPTRRLATAHVEFDGVELCRETVELGSARLPVLSLYPLQDVAVQRVQLRALEP